MAETTVKDAVRQVSLNDIKFNKDNALMAALSCIPIVGAVVFFVEKKDLFVRYYAAQFGLLVVAGLGLGVLMFVLGLIPVVNVIMGVLSVCLMPLLSLGSLILIIVAAMKAYKGERWDVPVLSKYALQMMNKF
ncbi:MAG: hypothetical protein UT34_C0001G0137 [candidate division WS6 bacterium GW2011_GWF2_39_15]|uniref:DUF4870 domain-containing protein n=1 Tax=candidate division WS6 bacterium GW2011_GWF2_39_15 TaxID=1619100 RepID=A0A0G0QWV7_9BACT|nr:MAG: hypothetical protein UT34_C0001G0137 [candidate division WS6 bacterium GW2011_GWF2_39_15]